MTILLLLLLFLPGTILIAKTRGTMPSSSAFSLGFVSVFAYFGLFAAVSRYVDVPFTRLTGSLGYAALLVAMWFSVSKSSPIPKKSLSQSSITVLGLALVSVFHLLIWNHALKFGAVLPNHDVYIHTNWVGNMARYESLSSIAAYTHPISGSGSAAPLYPFSMHALCAFVVQLASGHASEVVVGLTRLIVVIFWPLGIFSLARAIGFKTYIGAVAAAATTVALYNFPYSTLGWGGVSMIVGVVVLVHAVAVGIDFISKRTTQFLIVMTIGGFALLTSHTSEAFIFPLMLLTLGKTKIQSVDRSRQIFVLLTVMSVLAFTYPWIDKWWGNGNIANLAAAGVGAGTGTVYQGIGLMITLSAGMEFSSLWVPGILASGLVAVTYLNQYRNVLYFYGLTFLGAFITSQIGHKPWAEISMGFSPWYRQFQRMVYLIVPAVALLGGLAIEALVTYRSQRTVRGIMNAGRITIAFLSICAMLTFSWGRTALVFEILTSNYSTLSVRDLHAPEQISDLNDPISNTLSSFDSGTGYWAADYGSRVFGAPLLNKSLVTQRERLLDLIPTLGISEEARKLVKDLNISLVATNSRSMSGAPRPDPIALRSTGNFDEIWSGDSVKVWKLRPIVGGIAGSLSDKFEYLNGAEARWILQKSPTVEIHNLSKVSQQVNLTFNVYQNICNSVRTVTLDGFSPVEIGDDGLGESIDVNFLIGAGESLVRRIDIESKSCSDSGGVQLFAAFSNFRLSYQ